MRIKNRILEILNDANRPLYDMDIMKVLEIDRSQADAFLQALEELEKEGKVIKTKKRKYGTAATFGFVSGKLQSTQKGFAFLIPDDKTQPDVFIPASELMGAMHDDRVLVKVITRSGNGKKAEGIVEQITERANYEIVGTFEENKGGFGFVMPDDRKINTDVYVPAPLTGGAKTGDKVVVRINKWPDGRRNPSGKVTEILGQKGDSNTDILSVIRKFKLPEEFPKKVTAAAERIPEEVSEEEIANRRDLREWTIVTIDGADAKDLDDAISLTKLDNGNWQLGVHIADVTHYVTEKSALDKEALKRATSVYLVDRVIPMLPRRLSNGICSLNPKVDRLTMTCLMEIDQNGGVVGHEIFESVIKTNERMTYTDVSDMLEGNYRDELEKYDYLFDFFKEMEVLCKILRAKRDKRGAIDFNFPEAKIILDEDGYPTEIKRAERRIANRVIEEFMLVANETVAEYAHWMDIPFVFRIHETPSDEKIAAFNKFVHNFGYYIKGAQGEVHPKAIQKLLAEVEGKPEEHVISKLTLRSLRQAKYTPNNESHFGLAAKYYTHFTSPIRRYPDLQIHRILKDVIHQRMTPERIEKLTGIVEYACDQSSEQERIAEQAERDTDDMKFCEYMLRHIDEEFEGMISSITSFGMFIELPNTVEGLVRLRDLNDDYYIYDEQNLQLIGERSKNVYKLGDKVRVRVDRVDVDFREIDFELLEHLQ